MLVGLPVLEVAFICRALGMANLDAAQDVWWNDLHIFVWKDFPIQFLHSGSGVLASAKLRHPCVCIEFLSKVFNNKNNKCGYGKRAYAK